MTKRQVFYSFHYKRDNWRAAKIRNIGVIEGNKLASDNDWEAVKRGGDSQIEKWIDEQLKSRSCTIVLIGEETDKRKWVQYEIKKSWNDGKGILGIHIHNLKDQYQRQSIKGINPFRVVSHTQSDRALTINSSFRPFSHRRHAERLALSITNSSSGPLHTPHLKQDKTTTLNNPLMSITSMQHMERARPALTVDNPFNDPSYIQCYDPPYMESEDVYNYIKNNLESWVEQAIDRAKYSRSPL